MSGASLPGAAYLLAVDESQVTPGVLGFLVVAALAVATWLLIRSMSRQLKKINFAERDRGDGAPPAAEPSGVDKPPGGRAASGL